MCSSSYTMCMLWVLSSGNHSECFDLRIYGSCGTSRLALHVKTVEVLYKTFSFTSLFSLSNEYTRVQNPRRHHMECCPPENCWQFVWLSTEGLVSKRFQRKPHEWPLLLDEYVTLHEKKTYLVGPDKLYYDPWTALTMFGGVCLLWHHDVSRDLLTEIPCTSQLQDGITHVQETPRIEFGSMTMQWTAPAVGTGCFELISSHQQGMRTAFPAHHRFIYGGCTRTLVVQWFQN